MLVFLASRPSADLMLSFLLSPIGFYEFTFKCVYVKYCARRLSLIDTSTPAIVLKITFILFDYFGRSIFWFITSSWSSASGLNIMWKIHLVDLAPRHKDISNLFFAVEISISGAGFCSYVLYLVTLGFFMKSLTSSGILSALMCILIILII